jgi:hypothetical protein
MVRKDSETEKVNQIGKSAREKIASAGGNVLVLFKMQGRYNVNDKNKGGDNAIYTTYKDTNPDSGK